MVPQKVQELKNKFNNLHLETRPKKAGLGTAYLFGFKWALKKVMIQWSNELIYLMTQTTYPD